VLLPLAPGFGNAQPMRPEVHTTEASHRDFSCSCIAIFVQSQQNKFKLGNGGEKARSSVPLFHFKNKFSQFQLNLIHYFDDYSEMCVEIHVAKQHVLPGFHNVIFCPYRHPQYVLPKLLTRRQIPEDRSINLRAP